jgi:ribosomal protein S18 acetylase RimI-like enzyme
MLTITPAMVDDQDTIIELVETIWLDMALPVYQVLRTNELREVIKQAAELDEDSRYAFRRATVARGEDGAVLGVMFGYPAEDESRLDDTMQLILAREYGYYDLVFPDPEAYPNEWYLETLAVSASARGRGVGTKLLTIADEVARQNNQGLVGLNVDLGNPKAKALYEREGFTVVGNLMLGPHRYEHMQRQVK